MNNIQKALTIGLITRPHGIKGELCVQYYADSLFLLKAPIFLISPDDDIIEVKERKYKQAKDHVILSLDFCKDRNKAEELRNYEICIDPLVMRDFIHKHTPSSNKSKQEEVFVFQLVGLEVFHSKGQEKAFLGELKHIDFMGGQEIWHIYTKDNKEILFPAVPDFVEDINLDEKTITITPPEGLIDIYLEDNDKEKKKIKNKE